MCTCSHQLQPHDPMPYVCPGASSQVEYDQPGREGLWTIVRDSDGEVTRVWDAPNPGLMKPEEAPRV